MTTRKELDRKLDAVNTLLNEDLIIFRYQRTKYPYALKHIGGAILFRGSSDDIYNILDAMLLAVNTYRSNHNLR